MGSIVWFRFNKKFSMWHSSLLFTWNCEKRASWVKNRCLVTWSPRLWINSRESPFQNLVIVWSPRHCRSRSEGAWLCGCFLKPEEFCLDLSYKRSGEATRYVWDEKTLIFERRRDGVDRLWFVWANKKIDVIISSYQLPIWNIDLFHNNIKILIKTNSYLDECS